MTQLHCFLLEDETSSEDDVGALAALKRAAASVGARVTPRRFRNADTFLAGMKEAVEAAKNGLTLLVISSHGKEASGTWIAAKDGAFSAFEVMHLVPPRPAGLIVYVSACWGAYPDFPGALQWRSDPAPPVLGPLVEILTSDADGFQHELVELVAAGVTEESLVQLVRRWNAKVLDKYKKPVFAIVLPDGSRIPAWGIGGFAGKELRDFGIRVVAVQRSPGLAKALSGNAVARGGDKKFKIVADSDEPDVLVVEDHARHLWTTLAAYFGDSVPDPGTRFRIDATRRSKPLHPQKPALVGQLVELHNVREVGFKKVRHRYPFARGIPEDVEGIREVPPAAAGECVRCKWAALGRQLVQRLDEDGGESLEPRAVCICTKSWNSCPIQDRL